MEINNAQGREMGRNTGPTVRGLWVWSGNCSVVNVVLNTWSRGVVQQTAGAGPKEPYLEQVESGKI